MSVSGWRERTLGELLEIKHGYAFKGEFFGSTGTHIVLTPGNFLDEGGFKTKGGEEKWYAGPIPPEYVLEKGDVIVAMTEQAEGLLGSSAIIPASGLYLHNQRIGLVKLRPDLSPAPRFVYYLFNTGAVRAQIRASASGAKIRHTAPARIAEVKVSVPAPREQSRVAGILSAYDDLIDNNLRRIRILEEIARAIYREWFVHIRYPGHADGGGERHLPSDWDVRRLGELAQIDRGLSYKGVHLGNQGLPMVNLKCITPGGGFRLDGVKGYSGKFKASHAVRAGDLVFANTDLTQAGKIIGSAALLPRRVFAGGGLASHHICVVRPRGEPSLAWYLYHALSDLRFQDFARARASGTTVLGFRSADAAEFPIQIPAGDVLSKFESIVGPMHALSEVLADQTEIYRTTRDLLLPRLMSGRLSLAEAAL